MNGPGLARILIVEDDPSTAALLREVLYAGNYAVETVSDAASTLAALDAGTVDLLILDLMLADFSGLEICRRVRAREQGPYVPIIVITALNSRRDCHEGFAAGADDYIRKPFDVDEVLDRVNVWARTARRLSEVEATRGERNRLEGALLAARTMEDRLRNHLALTMGYLELVATNPRLAAELRPHVDEALNGAQQIETTLARLSELTGLVESQAYRGLGTTIDIERSANGRR